jgi:hypothetical protein
LPRSVAQAQDSATQTVVPAVAHGVLLNPGKGWVLYGRCSDHTADTLALGTVGYLRLSWESLEPQEGGFRWELLDKLISEWAGAGKQFAFGVMCANSHGPLHTTPKWVFDAGAKFRRVTLTPRDPSHGAPGDKIVPEFDDPIFLEKLKSFVSALGKRYDGNPKLAFVDIRSYGNWGEGHLHPFGGNPISKEALRAHIRMHRDAFTHTLLVLPWGTPDYDDVYDWAVSQGIGMRRDGICGNSDGRETARCLGQVPAVFEFYGSYEYLQERGWWEGKTQWGHGYRLVDCVERGSPSYISMSLWGRETQTFLATERPLIEQLANRMGYHLVIAKAEVPRTIRAGVPVTLTITWENRGVAYLHVPCRVALAILDDDSHVLGCAWAEGSNPLSWAPGQAVQERLSATFKVLFGNPSAPRLALGLCNPNVDSGYTPTIALGIEDGTSNRWYPLATVEWQQP